MADQNYEAIIVLGGGISNDGVLSEVSTSRVEQALELYQTRRMPIVMSGRWSLLAERSPVRTEAAAMRDYALRKGAMSGDVFIEEKSMETMGNAYFTYMQYIGPQAWKRVGVVTSAFHAERAGYAFNKILGDDAEVHLLPAPNPFTPEDEAIIITREAAILAFFRKLFGPVADGDREGVYAILQNMEGYGSNPRYSRQQLKEIVMNVKLGGLYG